MPKSSESPIYLYWDHALLLVLAAVAIYITLTHVISSPIQSSGVGGQKLTPQKMVTKISNDADALRMSLQRSATQTVEQSEIVEDVRHYLEDVTAQTPTNSLTPRISGGGVQAKTATPSVLAPGNIRAQGYIGVVSLGPRSRRRDTTTQSTEEIYWVTIAADFPFQKQYLAFAGIEPKVDEENRLDEEDQYFTFARLELERKQLLPDGSWSQPQSVDPYQTYKESKPNIVQGLSKLYSLPQGYNEKDIKNLDLLLEWLTKSGFQEFIVRPEFLPIKGFEQWYWPEKPPEISDEKTTDPRIAGALPRGDTAPKYAKKLAPARRGQRPNRLPSMLEPPPGYRRGGEPVEPARRTSSGRINRASIGRVALPQNYRLSDAPESIPIWVHDASVKPSSTYMYRLRVSLFNPLCGSDRAERSVRRQGWLSGEWSHWSQPVKTLQDRYLFFTGVSSPIASKPARAKISVYAWDDGYWFRQSFRAGKGQVIGAPKEVTDPAAVLPAAATDSRRRRADSPSSRLGRPGRMSPKPPPAAARKKIDFTTEWTVLEFNANIQVERPIAEKPDEFQTVNVDELLIENAKTGKTDKRYSDADKANTQKLALDQRIKRRNAALRPSALTRPDRRRGQRGQERSRPEPDWRR